MSNRSIEQALSQLLPTHDNDLPSELVNLSISLLAQSRGYASSLKPEEEIARPYVCAEIACNRLASSLKLPPPYSRPPCPPRVYKKLYTYLEQSLVKSSTRPKRQAAAAPSTPNKTPSKKPVSTPAATIPAKRTRAGPSKKPTVDASQTSIKDAPTWVMPLVRRICKALATPTPTSTARSRPAISTSFPPHIFAGISSIISFISSSATSEKRAENKDLDEFLEPLDTPDGDGLEEYKVRVKTLAVAVYFTVLARRQNLKIGSGNSKSSRKLDPKTYIDMCNAALAGVGLPSGQQKLLRQEVDAWTENIMKCDWATGMEWFENIPLPGDREGDEAGTPQGGHPYDEEEDEDSGLLGPNRRRQKAITSSEKVRGGLQPGLGTMMQDRVDWLSEDRRADFLEWKGGIMDRIKGLEKGGNRVAAR